MQSNAASGRVLAKLLNNVNQYWADTLAEKVIETFPDEQLYTCAAGISPSGVVHFGNFRDVITSLAVVKSLQKKGKKARLLFSWDDFDRFRKVPAGVDLSYMEHVGKPLTSIPDPEGKDESYARRFEVEFENAMKELNIELDYRYQTKEYTSGRYDDEIFYCLQRRDEIARTLLSFMSDKGKAEKNIDEKEYRAAYYPISLYSRFTGKDNTEILEYDGKTSVTYKCRDTGKTETVDLSRDHIAKLAWKIDWPMRWKAEGVTFEPGGHDHASPGGSYDTSSILSQKIFNRQGPVFVGYEFIGIQGLGSKMSGSKGNAVSPADLLEVYEPELLKWLYFRKNPHQKFQLAFDSEINRQYEEFDRECKAYREGHGSPDGGKLSVISTAALELSFDDIEKTMCSNPIPFRYAVAFGQIVQWQPDKVMELLKGVEMDYDEKSVEIRLQKAKNWLETYNPQEIIKLRDEVNNEYLAAMSDQAKEYIRTLRKKLGEKIESIHELELLVYSIPKDTSLSDKENSPRQRAFFKDVYNLLIGADTGPRLSTFLWAVDREKVLKLLDI